MNDVDRLAAGIKAAMVVRLISGDTNQTYTPTEVSTLVTSVVDEQVARLTVHPDLSDDERRELERYRLYHPGERQP